MILTLEILGEQAEALGASSRKVFRSMGGTIGRLPDNDWVFPDPYVSGRHALIRYLNGEYYIEDTSTNGVAINSPENRISRTDPHPLRHGDVLYVDAYEIGVSIEPAAVQEGDPFKRLWQDPSRALSASVSGADDTELQFEELDLAPEDLLATPTAAKGDAGKHAVPGAADRNTQRFAPDQAPRSTPPDDNPPREPATKAGTEGPGLSLDPRYPAQAMSAMRLAFQSMLAQFDPDRLQEDFDRQISRDSKLGAPAKMRYWDLYRDRYAIVARDADGAFRSLFAAAFSAACEENPEPRGAEVHGRET
jgi:predicted component of type VI protein secretion system